MSKVDPRELVEEVESRPVGINRVVVGSAEAVRKSKGKVYFPPKFSVEL